ncbi:MAG TPA: MG2 domain-containing protein, partial [Thermoanaerobaculia bacterium]|nr:MG2 domain-containing protein [Thermoanaerobaculia bacterium]
MRALILSLLFLLSLPAAALAQLTVVSASPEGELQALEQANEIRIVFSEPMIVIGKVPEPVRPPFIRIEPAIAGNFRWSGTNTLIFRPDPEALRYATAFRVTIDSSARSIHGSALKAPYVFTFTTPTIKLRHTRWYEKANGAVVFWVSFNQPIDERALLPHVHATLSPHEADFSGIKPPPAASASVDPNATANFNAKKERVRQAARSSKKILVFEPEEWDDQRFAKSPNVLILETQPGIPPGAWIRLVLDESTPSPGGSATPGAEQEFVAMRGPGFFVKTANCLAKCDPDHRVAILLTEGARLEDLQKAVTVTDVTDRAAPRVLKPEVSESEEIYDREQFSLEDLGYTIEPARTLRVAISPSLRAASGEPLGYGWAADIEFWHRSAYSSFGEGHGVWEPEGGPLVPFWARNLQNVKQWLVPLEKEELMPTLLQATEKGFRLAPAATPVVRTLRPVADELQSYGLDARSVLSDDLRGLFWAAVEEGAPIARSRRLETYDGKPVPKSTIVQATDIGLTLKHSPLGALVWATRLSDASPVAGAAVEIRDRGNRVVWSGVTDRDGVALAPNVNLRKEWWQLEFIAVAESAGDVAYVANDWHEGIVPWEFGIPFSPEPGTQRLRGSVFTDRGVYRPGEEIHAKLILRDDAGEEIALLPAGTDVKLTVRNARNDVVAEATVELGAWSSAEWSWKIPSTAVLGNYLLSVTPAGREDTVAASFLVAAYRRPDFRVDADLGSADAIAGANLQATIEGRYLFGAAMGGMPVRWRYTTERVFSPPEPVRALLPGRGFVWTGDCDEGWEGERQRVIREDEGRLSGSGTLALELETEREAGEPRLYTIEGEVTDISRQAIAGRASFLVHPAPWYIGLRRSDWFVTTPSAVATEVVAASPAGEIVPGVKVDVTLTRVQWHSVRRAEGNGFYTWESERREEPAGNWSLTTGAQPVPLEIPIPQGGYYIVT